MRARSPRRCSWAPIGRRIGVSARGGMSRAELAVREALGAHADAVHRDREGVRPPRRAARPEQRGRTWSRSGSRRCRCRASPGRRARAALRGVGAAQCPDRRRGSRALRALAKDRSRSSRCCATAPSVGPLTASAVVATIDDVTRFPSAHQFEAYLGLVPASGAPGRNAASVGSRRRGTRARAISSSRRRGASSAPRRRRRPRCGRGRSRSPRGAANASRPSRSRVASPGSCTRCGETTPRTTPPSCAVPRPLPTRGQRTRRDHRVDDRDD